MKKILEWIEEYWILLVFGPIIICIFLGCSYWVYDAATGKTIIVQGEVIAHRYKPAWTDSGVRTDIVTDANGNVTPQITAYSHHYPEEFIITVYGPDGPDSFNVRESTYHYFRDHDRIPLARRIGGRSKKCVKSWIIER